MTLHDAYREYIDAMDRGDDDMGDYPWNNVIYPMLRERNWFDEPGTVRYNEDVWIEYDGKTFRFRDGDRAWEVSAYEWNEANLSVIFGTSCRSFAAHGSVGNGGRSRRMQGETMSPSGRKKYAKKNGIVQKAHHYG